MRKLLLALVFLTLSLLPSVAVIRSALSLPEDDGPKK
jgi:hypothetical protein